MTGVAVWSAAATSLLVDRPAEWREVRKEAEVVAREQVEEDVGQSRSVGTTIDCLSDLIEPLQESQSCHARRCRLSSRARPN